MISFNNIIGHEKIIDFLIKRIKNDKIGHSYLFTGNQGIGKKLTAIAFGKAVNCDNFSKLFDSCNNCNSCKKIEKGINSEFKLIEPINSVIKIEQIRDIKRDIYLQPTENRKKVYIIDEADRMNIEASNSLLKILEEPPNYAVIILITTFFNSILPTIISRCCHLSFKPLTFEQQKTILSATTNFNHDELDRLFRLSFGITGKRLVEENNLEKIKFKEQYINILAKTEPWKMEEFVFKYEKIFPGIKENFYDFLEILLLWFRDILILKVGVKNNKQLSFSEQYKKIEEYSEYYSRKRLIMIIYYLLNIPGLLEKHINQNNLLENIFLELGD